MSKPILVKICCPVSAALYLHHMTQWADCGREGAWLTFLKVAFEKKLRDCHLATPDSRIVYVQIAPCMAVVAGSDICHHEKYCLTFKVREIIILRFLTFKNRAFVIYLNKFSVRFSTFSWFQ